MRISDWSSDVCSSDLSRVAAVVYSLAHAAAPYGVLSLFAQPGLMATNNSDHEEMLALYKARDRAGVYRKTEHHLVQTLEAIEQEAEAKADPGYWQGQGSQSQGGQVQGGLAMAAPEGSAR